MTRWLIPAALAMLVARLVLADMPAAQVITQSVPTGGVYYTVPAHTARWFDVGGFCKIVAVNDLSSFSWANPNDPSNGIPVFDPGSAAQWENWRQKTGSGPSVYGGQLQVSTCCRPQSNIGTLCANAYNPTPISRAYGAFGESDKVSAVCQGAYGQYTESVIVTCAGTTGTPSVDNGPDGQGAWVAGGNSDLCTPNAQTVLGACNAPGNCGSGSQTVSQWNSCGQLESQTTQACDTGVGCGIPCTVHSWTSWTVNGYLCAAQFPTMAPFTTGTLTDVQSFYNQYGVPVDDRGSAIAYCDGNTGTPQFQTAISCYPNGAPPVQGCTPNYSVCDACQNGLQTCYGQCGAGGTIQQACTVAPPPPHTSVVQYDRTCDAQWCKYPDGSQVLTCGPISGCANLADGFDSWKDYINGQLNSGPSTSNLCLSHTLNSNAPPTTCGGQNVGNLINGETGDYNSYCEIIGNHCQWTQ